MFFWGVQDEIPFTEHFECSEIFYWWVLFCVIGFAAEYQPGFGDESNVRINGHWRTGEAFSPGKIGRAHV